MNDLFIPLDLICLRIRKTDLSRVLGINYLLYFGDKSLIGLLCATFYKRP